MKTRDINRAARVISITAAVVVYSKPLLDVSSKDLRMLEWLVNRAVMGAYCFASACSGENSRMKENLVVMDVKSSTYFSKYYVEPNKYPP